jgi:predicted MFS family arabinose efflux permease
MEVEALPSRSQVVVMAATAGVTVANLYYNQPILGQIASSFGASEAQVGNLPVLTQAGYGLGLLLLTPLGDMIDRKKLIVTIECLLIVALLGVTMTPSLWALYVASFVVGILAVSVQIIMPMAASMTAKKHTGRVVGMVFTGTLIGILSARVMSGYVAEAAGWRWVYAISAGLVLLATTAVVRSLPNSQPQLKGTYASLLRSTVHQIVRFPLLRRVTLQAALVFGVFCSFWTTLTFHLGAAPFSYSSDVIGLFGLLAVAGTLAAPIFGRMADKRNPAEIQMLTIGLIIVSVLLVQWLPTSVAVLVVTTFLLDVGVQATQVNNLAQIYVLDEEANSRINTVFITTLFIGGAIGTYAGVSAWALGGWALVCWQLLAWSLLALVMVAQNYRLSMRTVVPQN